MTKDVIIMMGFPEMPSKVFFILKSVLLDQLLSDLSHSVITSNDLSNFKIRSSNTLI